MAFVDMSSDTDSLGNKVYGIKAHEKEPHRPLHLRAVPEMIRGGWAIVFSDSSIPRTNMESEPPDPQDT